MPKVITPSEITPTIVEFCRSFGCPDAPFFIEIEPAHFAENRRCHHNVTKQIAEDGGLRVYGWAIWTADNGDWIEGEFHSIYQSPKGELIDITPDPDGETRRLFVRDPVREFKGFALPRQYKVLTTKEHVKRGIAKFAEANRLRSKYGDGEPISQADSMRILFLEGEGCGLVNGLAMRLASEAREPSSRKQMQLDRQLKRRAKKDRKVRN